MSRDRRHPFQAAVIDVGSHAVRMDVFEADADGSVALLESLTRSVDLGREVFRRGAVSPDGMELLGEVMQSYRRKLDEYRITQVRAIATSALREAFNRDLVVDRLRYLTGISIDILESTQEIRLIYLSMREELAKRMEFNALHGMTVVIGAGSLFVVYFEQGLMRFCEELAMGTDRLPDTPDDDGEGISGQIVSRLESVGVLRRLHECVDFSPETRITLIGMGAAARTIADMLKCSPADAGDITFTTAEAAEKLTRDLARKSSRTLAEKLGVSREEAGNVIAAAGVFNYFWDNFHCERLLFPGVTTRSAVIDDLVRGSRAPENSPFDADLAAICRAIGRKYATDAGHAETTAELSEALRLKLRSRCAFSSRSGILLGAAARLHDIGRFINPREHHRHSGYIISNLQLPGVTGEELKIIAAVAYCHHRDEPGTTPPGFSELMPGSRVTVLKLAAILRVADALDCSRVRKFSPVKLNIRGNELLITPGTADTRAERAALAESAPLFTRVFGLDIRIGGTTL